MKKNILQLTVEPYGERISFEVKRLINAGYTGRNKEDVEAHIAELKSVGVSAPSSVPVYYPKSSQLISVCESVDSLDNDCSNEAEFVLIIHNGEVYVGCGADVFDKRVESLEGAKSKHLYSNQISPTIWRYKDIEENWDEIEIESWLGKEKHSLYQSKKLRDILEPEKILEFIAKAYHEKEVPDGTVIYSGTVEALIEGMPYTDYFTACLSDEKNSRTIMCSYNIIKIKEDWRLCPHEKSKE